MSADLKAKRDGGGNMPLDPVRDRDLIWRRRIGIAGLILGITMMLIAALGEALGWWDNIGGGTGAGGVLMARAVGVER